MESGFSGGIRVKGRTLCTVCLIILWINGIRLFLISGDTFIEVPACSIFFTEQKMSVVLQGQVYKKSNTLNNQIYYLKNNSLTYQNQVYHESKILIYDKSFIDIPIGKTVKLYGVAEAFKTSRNPGNFEQKLLYAKEGIYGYCYLEKLIGAGGKENRVKEQLYKIRQRWKSMIYEEVGDENGTVLSAMLLAEKSEMDADKKELYQKNGISHILAISGLHISFIGMGIYHILRRRLGFSFLISGGISIFVLTLYVLMIGFSVSVFRAYIMLMLKIVADITGRVYDVLTALFLSAAIIVLCEPLYLMDAAFYMSHGAILAIVLVVPILQKNLKCPRMFRYLKQGVWNSILSSLAINVTLFPILLYYYYEIPTYSIILNILVIPMMSVLLGCGMIGSGFVWCVPPIGKMLLTVCDFILQIFSKMNEIGCQLPFSRIVFGRPSLWQILIYYGVLLLFLSGKVAKILNWKKAKIGVILGLSLIFVKIPNGKLYITMLDVGQGDCIFLKGPYGDTYLIDGGSSDRNQVGKYCIEPYLESQGVSKLDYVFISHGDLDHCNGIIELLERKKVGVKIDTIVLPVNFKKDETLLRIAKLAQKQGVTVSVLDVNKSIVEGDLNIRCLQPKKEDALDGNAGSMVLEVEFHDFEMLFTGDVENEGEELLIKKLQRTYDVLKVAHHGSKNSTTEKFLMKTQPEIALISAGEENLYGHPHQETLERLDIVGSKVLETKKCGAIMLEIGEEMKVSTWLNGFH